MFLAMTSLLHEDTIIYCRIIAWQRNVDVLYIRGKLSIYIRMWETLSAIPPELLNLINQPYRETFREQVGFNENCSAEVKYFARK